MSKKYKGSCYIGVTGSDLEFGACRDSINAIIRRDGDAEPVFARATKGYDARQAHLNKWINETKHPFGLFLDADMTFQPDTLERLRAHGLPYVSGFYLRRMLPTAPVWYENGEVGVMPMRPMVSIVEENKLYPIGASGWGCVLMHRDVVMAVREVLRGEPDVIEDDMDVWPYDLAEVLQGRERLKPLRAVKDIVGSDIRFSFYAKVAGFQLWGDSGVQCGHIYPYPLQLTDYTMQSGAAIRDISLAIHKDQQREIEHLAAEKMRIEGSAE